MTNEEIINTLKLINNLTATGASLYAHIQQQSGKTDDELLAMMRELGDANEVRLLKHIAGLEHEPTRGV
ncbi:MAG: hypothetical protein ACR2LC_09590 [Pyrinomonadaceae bacterium]